MNTNYIALLFLLCVVQTAQSQTPYPVIGQVVRLDPRLDAIIAPNAQIEVLASGFEWSEGPVWVKDGGYLLFSDVPKNTIHKWKENEGLSVFLKPSGYTGVGAYSNEPGSNGLTLDLRGRLVACEHGDRRVSVMPLNGGGKTTIADRHAGKRFNSPNDVVAHSDGSFFFTDPPYGLPQQEKDPTRETPVFGVYRADSQGKTTLVVADLTRPNGIAFSPDEKILYVAQSDPSQAYVMAYPLLADGTVGKGRVFFDATPMVQKGLRGLPDGLRVDVNGLVFATGPGGVLIITPEGQLLGRIDTGQATANCAFGNDGSYLYLTSDMYLCRIKTKTKGTGF